MARKAKKPAKRKYRPLNQAGYLYPQRRCERKGKYRPRNS